jgi:hypothetical protein
MRAFLGSEPGPDAPLSYFFFAPEAGVLLGRAGAAGGGETVCDPRRLSGWFV